MDDVVVIESEDSENSIVEVEVPKKPTPPLINIEEEEEIILNVMRESQECILAKDFIENDKVLSVVSLPKRTKFCPKYWTRDMIKFYDDDWGDEDNFIVEKIQEKMDKTPSLWEVSRKDVLSMRNKVRKSNVRCWNCSQFGHHFTMCPDPPYTPKCHMCGSEGHLENGCPNSKCLNCGTHCREYVTCCNKCRRQQNEVCARCRTLGHDFNNCPDHWRLFHMTTGTTSVNIPDRNIYKLMSDMWCCNCGKRGHYHALCAQRNNCSGFMRTLPIVVSYQEAFTNIQARDKPNCARKKRRRRRTGNKSEKILRINPMHKAICKEKLKNNKKRRRFRNKLKKNGRNIKEGLLCL